MLAGSFLIDGPLVVWPESMKPDALTIMRTADAKTGRTGYHTAGAAERAWGGLVPVTRRSRRLLYATDNWRVALVVAVARC